MDITIIQNFFAEYGWAGLAISVLTILVIGTLKFFKVFNKIEKAARKPIYQGLVIAVIFGISAAYYGIFKVPFTIDFLYFGLGLSAFTTVLYAFYENFGLRKLLGIIGNFVITIIANDKIQKSISDAKVQTETIEQTEEQK